MVDLRNFPAYCGLHTSYEGNPQNNQEHNSHPHKACEILEAFHELPRSLFFFDNQWVTKYIDQAV